MEVFRVGNFESSFFIYCLWYSSESSVIRRYFSSISSVRCRNLSFLSLFPCLLSFLSSFSYLERLPCFCSLEKIASMFDRNKKNNQKQISRKDQGKKNSLEYIVIQRNVKQRIPIRFQTFLDSYKQQLSVSINFTFPIILPFRLF